MLDTLRHFAFEAITGGIGLALIGAGLAILGTPEGWLVRNIPLVGGFLDSSKHAAATVLIATGVGALAFVAGYAHRGTLDHSAALRNEIERQKAIVAARDSTIAEKERRAQEIAAAQEASDARADAISSLNADLQRKIEEQDHASRLRDNDPCLDVGGLRRLDAIGPGKGLRGDPAPGARR